MRTNHQPHIAVVADDLTSAADGAAPFVARGLIATIGRGQLPRKAAAVVAVDSGSRSATSSQAFERVARLTARLASSAVLYKTVDSTLRGYIAEELEACFAASGRKSQVFAPALPQAGRTTIAAARRSALADLVPNFIKNVTLLDAVTQEELDSQIASIEDAESILWVGSPGMAAALSRRFVPAKTLPPLIDGISNDVLVVIGSANLRSHIQADQLQEVNGVMLLRAPRARERDSATVLRRGGDTLEAVLDLLNVREFEILQRTRSRIPTGSRQARRWALAPARHEGRWLRQ